MNAKKRRSCFGVLISVFVIPLVLFAAILGCVTASSKIDEIIRSNEELSRLDKTLNNSYLQALNQADIKEKTIESQSQWITNERNVCQSVECIKNAYETRIQELAFSSSYGIVIFRDPNRNTPSPKDTAKVSKSEEAEPHDKLIQTQTKKSASAIDSSKHTPIVNKLRSLLLTGMVSTLAGEAGVAGSTNGLGAKARFNHPFGITTDGSNLYVSEITNQTIRKIKISTGEVTTLAGEFGKRGATDGIGRSARFNFPYGMATDGINLYVADSQNSAIRKVVIATGKVTTLAGTPGRGGTSDGIGMAAQFSSPQDVTIVGNNLYVVDRPVNTIRKITISTGEVTTVAGEAKAWGFTDGIGTAARFCLPESITTDGTNLYVADWFNNTIRKIAIETGEVTTLAGPDNATCALHNRNGKCLGGSNNASDDGLGAAARFNYPGYITCDGKNLYVMEGGRNIRKIVIATGKVSTLSNILIGLGSTAVIKGITNDGISLYATDINGHTIIKIQ